MTRKYFKAYNVYLEKEFVYIGYVVTVERYPFSDMYQLCAVRWKRFLFKRYRVYDIIKTFESLEEAYVYVDALPEVEV